MTSRERHASVRATAGARQPAAAPASAAHASPPADKARPPRWEDVYRDLTPDQQQELLNLAGRQGLLYAHQLPQRNGSPPPTRPILTELLAGRTTGLESVRPAPVAVRDAALDSAQREAVARALATPDLCLVRGLPGTGKSRVVAEIVTQAAARGERVLLLARSAAALDRVLELVGSCDEVDALRLLAPDECPEGLAPAVRARTPAERLRQLTGHRLPEARQAAALREQRCRRLRQDEPVWNRLVEIADRLEQLHENLEALARRRPVIPVEVEREAAGEAGDSGGPFRTDFARWLREFEESQKELDQELADLQVRIDKLNGEEPSLQAQVDALRPLEEARRAGRWWTWAWWRARSRKNLSEELAAAEERLQKTRTGLADARAEVERLNQGRAQAFETERARRIEAEAARRQMELDNQAAAFAQERDLLGRKWQAACATLDPQAPPLAAPSAEAARAARAAWQERLKAEEHHGAVVRQWIACLEDAGSWPARLCAYANVVAAAAPALAADPYFREPAADFELLIVQEADQLTEAEFLQAARRARRWVLVGEPGAPDHDAASDRSGGLHRPRGAALRPRLFETLWQHLHWEPRRLPYAWVEEAGRLCCRLRPVAPEQRPWIETEGLADFPDIELRILSVPQTTPQLVEVMFPAALSIAEAKAYIYRELEELAVQTAGRGAVWAEGPERLVFRLAEEGVRPGVAVELEPGVRERVGPLAPERDGPSGAACWHTCCLEFDRAAGWDRARAEEWVERRLGGRDLGRTARLDMPHRMHPDLAAFLSNVLFAGDYQGVNSSPDGHGPVEGPAREGCSPRVEFVAVPPLRDRAAPLPRKGGAGLEIDLADPRHRSRLPADAGPDLPHHGFVNVAEAQAVVRRLEALAADPAGLEASGAKDGAGLAAAVIALYPAQAELIRRLVRRSAATAAAPFAVEVDVPAAFRERECPVVLVSLTRSHSHRPVAFGEGPEGLALALTRARSKLVLFGDPGAIARRSQWEGPVEHLDEAAAARERELAAQLVRYLEGHPTAFRVREGAGT